MPLKSTRRWVGSLLLVGALVALAACSSKEEATPGPTTPAPTAGQAAWEQEWEQVLAAAKKEGKVVVAGPSGSPQRGALTTPFEKKYGITVEYAGFGGSEFPPRIQTERAAGQYLWDIFIGGTTTTITALLPMGVAEPIKPALILPEVTDLSKWKDGHIDFADKAEVYNIVSFVNPKAMIFYNKNLVDPKKLTSFRDLLSPEWKGKLVSFDPTSAGSGLATFTFYYTNPALGEDFIRQLAGQGIRTTRDQDQVVRWVAEGAAAIAIAFGEDNATPLIKAGAPVGIIQTLKEGGYFTTGSTSLLLMNRAPHPNAAKVFVNWFLSKDGATAFGTAVGWNTRRVDIPQDYIPEYGRIAPGVKYDETNYKEDMVYRKDEIAAVVRKYLQQ